MTWRLANPKAGRQQLHLQGERYIINGRGLDCQREHLDLARRHLTSWPGLVPTRKSAEPSRALHHPSVQWGSTKAVWGPAMLHSWQAVKQTQLHTLTSNDDMSHLPNQLFRWCPLWHENAQAHMGAGSHQVARKKGTEVPVSHWKPGLFTRL